MEAMIAESMKMTLRGFSLRQLKMREQMERFMRSIWGAYIKRFQGTAIVVPQR